MAESSVFVKRKGKRSSRKHVSRKLPYFFRENEEQAFLKACEKCPRDHCIWRILFDGGFRIAELVGDKRTEYRGLYVEDIDFASRQVRIFGKGRKERMLIMSKRAIDEILKWLGDRREGKIFDITPRMVQKLAWKYAKEAGLPIHMQCKKCGQRDIPEEMKACPSCGNTKLVHEHGRWSPHKARHTHLTKIVEKGGRDALVVAQERAGHVSLATTSIYLHTSTEYQKAVMEKVYGES